AADVLPIAIGIIGLIVIVAISYRQTIHAYPGGGGAYIVAKENLGQMAGLIAGAALLIDYVLTAAVSVASGIAAFTSAVPAFTDQRILLCLLIVLFIALANLRGARESGALFAFPTYGFVVIMLVMLALGFYRFFTGQIEPVIYPPWHLEQAHGTEDMVKNIGLFLILRAFASGCAALTGIEAVSNGVTAFRKPEADNASTVLGWMAGILGTLFFGITFLSMRYHLLPYGAEQEDYQTIVSQLAMQVFHGRNVAYFLVQGFTTGILLLAANTAFADFPRLASLMARDGYLPRQFGTLGDKLVFANGIVILGLFACVLLVAFGGDTHQLIPLYAVGVFLSFTLSQSGMVIHWLKEKAAHGGKSHHKYSLFINGFGAILTFLVLIVIGYTKFVHGAWIVVVLIPILVAGFLAIKRHYADVARQLSLEGQMPPESDPHKIHHVVLVPISGIQLAVVRALQYAKSMAADAVRVVYVNLNQATTDKLVERWGEWGMGIPLVILESPYRSILDPLVRYVERVQDEPDTDFITVLLPEFLTARWWHAFLHNQTAFMLRTFLTFKEGVVVTSVRWHLKR
ncbi:MAG: APC family permease, partial [bacterium]